MSCSYCIVHSVFNSSCRHFSLTPNSWSVEDGKSQKKNVRKQVVTDKSTKKSLNAKSEKIPKKCQEKCTRKRCEKKDEPGITRPKRRRVVK